MQSRVGINIFNQVSGTQPDLIGSVNFKKKSGSGNLGWCSGILITTGIKFG